MKQEGEAIFDISKLPNWSCVRLEYLLREYNFVEYTDLLDFVASLLELTRESEQRPGLEINANSVAVRVLVPETEISEPAPGLLP